MRLELLQLAQRALTSLKMERESTSKGSLYFYNYTHYDARAQCASQGYGPIKHTLGAVVSMFKFSLHTNLLIVRVTCHL